MTSSEWTRESTETWWTDQSVNLQTNVAWQGPQIHWQHSKGLHQRGNVESFSFFFFSFQQTVTQRSRNIHLRYLSISNWHTAKTKLQSLPWGLDLNCEHCFWRLWNARLPAFTFSVCLQALLNCCSFTRIPLSSASHLDWKHDHRAEPMHSIPVENEHTHTQSAALSHKPMFDLLHAQILTVTFTQTKKMQTQLFFLLRAQNAHTNTQGYNLNCSNMHDLIWVFPGRWDWDWLVGCQELLFFSLAKDTQPYCLFVSPSSPCCASKWL